MKSLGYFALCGQSIRWLGRSRRKSAGLVLRDGDIDDLNESELLAS
jgi:hypothetical protein